MSQTEVNPTTPSPSGEEMLRLVADHIPALVSYIDQEFRYQFANETYSEWFGIPVSEIVGKPIPEVIGEEAFAAVKRHLERALAGETIRYDTYMPYPSGGHRFVQTQLVPDRLPSGEIRGFVALIMDISEQRKSEEALAASETRLRIAMDAGQMGAWEYDFVRDKVTWSPGLERIHGLEPGTFGGTFQHYLDDVHPDDRDRVAKTISSSIEGHDHQVEYRLLLKDGTIKWVEGRGRMFYDEAGNPARLAGVCMDVTARKNADESRRLSEERFRFLAESNPEFIWTAHPDGTIDYVNQRWLEFTGAGSDEDFTEAVMSRVHPEDAERLRTGYFGGMQAGVEFSVDHRLRGADGEYRWLRGRAVPMPDAAGNVVKWFGVCSDIHDRMLIEQALRESEQRFRRMVEQLPLSVQIIDAKGVTRQVNKAFEELWGLNLVTLGDYNILEDEQLVELGIMPLIRRALNGETCRIPAAPYHPDRGLYQGLARWVRAFVYPVIGEDGTVTEIVLVHEDITEQKKAEQALRQSEEQYRFLANSNAGTIWLAEADGRLSYISARWLEMTGMTEEEAYNGGWGSAMHPDDMPQLAAKQQRAAETKTEFRGDHRVRTADGSYRWVTSRAMPHLDAKGEVSRWFGITLDIQESKETEEELERRVQERTAELQAAVRELEGFTYSVSHDLRAPLRAINSTSAILNEDYGSILPQEAKDQLQRQASAARKMGILIDELLKLSRLARQELHLTAIDLSALAHSVIQELKHDGCTFAVQPGLIAQGDPTLLRLVLSNLLENAIKFSPNGGTIELGSQRAEGERVFFVKDQGIGFDMQFAPKLFLPFERLVSEEAFPGTGIGLANVQRIIQRHGGRVWAESEPGAGATFYFTLPERR